METQKLITIVHPPCWRLTPVDLCDFFRNVNRIAPDGAILRLESGAAKEIEDFMANRPAIYPNESANPKWLIFKNAKVFFMPLTKSDLEQLADLCENYAAPEIGNELGIYLNDELILSWHDLPDDPVYVSLSISEIDVKEFCSILNSEYFYEK